MSSRSFDKALHLKPQASTTFAMLLILLHLGASLSVMVVIPTTHPALLLLIPVFIYSAYYHFKKHISLSANCSVVGLSQSTDGDWLLRLHDKSELHAELCDDSYVHPLLIILNFKIISSYRRISLPLFRDAFDAEQHRQLRSRLRLSRPAEKEKILRR